MKKYAFVFATVFATAITLFVVQTPAQIKSGKERPLLTKSWMAGINQPHCARLGEILKSGPANEKEWAEAARHAEILNESGHVLMADSRCPDKVWADAATQLREGSAAVLSALHEKNATGAQSAFNNQLVKACGNCHETHKK